MDFLIILPCGGEISITLKAHQQVGKYLLDGTFDGKKIDSNWRQYFGLLYPDKEDGGFNWLLPSDKLRNIYCLNRRVHTYELTVRVFPKEPHLAFSTYSTRRLYRQCIKRLLTDFKLGCSSKQHALLDAYLLQAETGDFYDFNYLKRLKKYDINTPSSLNSSFAVKNEDFLTMVKDYHEKMIGTASAQADIEYLKLARKLPYYGYFTYSATSKSRNNFFIGISSKGMHFIYESYLSSYIIPNEELFSWESIVFIEKRKKIIIGVLIDYAWIKIKKFKIKSLQYNDRTRFETDLMKHVEIYCRNEIGGKLFASRKQACNKYPTKIPKLV